MFCKLTRLDLKDLFPVDFLARKKFSDLLSNLQQEPDLVSYTLRNTAVWSIFFYDVANAHVLALTCH